MITYLSPFLYIPDDDISIRIVFIIWWIMDISKWKNKTNILFDHQVKSHKWIGISITCPVIFQAVHEPYQIFWAVLLDSVDLFKFCPLDDIAGGHQGDLLYVNDEPLLNYSMGPFIIQQHISTNYMSWRSSTIKWKMRTNKRKKSYGWRRLPTKRHGYSFKTQDVFRRELSKSSKVGLKCR